MRERKNKCEREMNVKMYSMNPYDRERERESVCGVMRWPVLGGT